MWFVKLKRPMYGIIEVEESLFAPRPLKRKRGRGAFGKTTVFGAVNAWDNFELKSILTA